MTSHDISNSPTSPASKSSFLPTGIRSSPRSSVDSGSPFLQNLQQRFRKASNASHTSLSGADGARKGSGASPTVSTVAANDGVARMSPTSPNTTATKSRSEATRVAKRYIMEVVKDDWVYPPQRSEDASNKPPIRRDVLSWRRREDGMSDLESEKEAGRRRSGVKPASAAYSNLQTQGGKGAQTQGGLLGDPYKFDNPDAVGDFVEAKRRKRRKVVDEECEWNEGMRNWVLQRDMWTGAMEVKPEKNGHQPGHAPNGKGLNLSSSTSSRLNEGDESGGTEDSQPLSAASRDTKGTRELSESSMEEQLTRGGGAVSGEEGPWLPIYPPLFDEDNILRSRIQPTAYATIYSKVVVQSLTPNIPIPLTHMTKVLVEGWKSEGNWPSGAATAASLAAAKDAKGAGTKGSVSAFLRWRNSKTATGEEKEGRREKVRRSIGLVVKKAVGLGAGESKEIVQGGKELREVGIEFDEEMVEPEAEGGAEAEVTAEEEREASRIY